MKDESFTPSQVGTLLEAMDKKIDLIAENVVTLNKNMVDVESCLTNVETDVRLIKDVIRVEIPSIKSRLTALEKGAA